MKALIISCGFHPVTNGMGGAIENLIETYLLENEKTFQNEVTLYSVITNRGQQERNFKYTEIRRINKTTIKYKLKQISLFLLSKINKKYRGNAYIREVVKDLKRKNELEKYECIIIENIGKFVPFIRKYTKSKLVFHLHNDYLNKKTGNAKEIISSCDKIWGVSNFICNQVKEVANPEDRTKVELLYNGIDFSKITKEISGEEKKKLKEKYGFQENEKVILYTGRLMPEKGVKELLLAFQQLAKERKEIGLLLAGGTKQISTNKDGYVETLQKIANSIENTIVFTGNIPYRYLFEVYAIADMQIVPTIIEEAFGLAVIEGMACSIPLIVTRSGGIPEIVYEDYRYMIEKDDNIVNSLYQKMEEMLSHVEEIKEEIEKYPKKLARFTNEIYSENFNRLLNKVKEME